MADYNVQSSDGTFTVNVQTGTINNNYDIPFIGQDAINYGDDLVAAQLRQLENFSNTSAPSFGTTRVKGQLWYDSTPSTGRLNIFDGSSWDIIPLDIDVVHLSGAETINDVKTFSSAPVFSAAGAPITVNSNTVVANLNADQVDGLDATAFGTAAQGALADTAEQALGNPGTNGFALVSTTGGIRSWTSLSVASGQVATDPTSTLDTTTNVLLVGNEAATTGGTVQDPLYATGLTYNAATSTLSTLNFIGTLTGTASNATTATTATTATNATNVTVATVDGDSGDTAMYPVLVAANTAIPQLPHTDVGQLSYNASTGQLNATLFVGNGAGITNLNLSAGSHTGTLAVARGGTGVTTATGSGTAVVLHTSPTFVTDITAPIVNNSSGVGIQFNGTSMVTTQNNVAIGQTTGGQIRHHDTNLYDIGMNVLPQFGWDTTDTLEAQHCGMLTGHSDGAAHTLTLEASGTTDFPIGGVTTIINGSATDYTVTEGAGTTLFYIEPGVGGTDTTGGCTVGAGGAATLYRFDATDYFIWGSEITFTP